MRLAAPLAAPVLLSLTVALSAQGKSQTGEPVSWGALSGNSACVIFVEGRKTSGRFYGVAVTTKTVGKLTVVESQNYTLPEKEILETQDNMDNLMRVAQKDHVKFVKIPDKYSPDLLDKARSACKAGVQ